MNTESRRYRFLPLIALAVVEPCNFLGKFPNVPVLLRHYLSGETLIESYWKSVEMPGQGLFIGEPLAAPFRPR